MLFKAKSTDRRLFPLKPFLLRIRGGHLLGLAMDPVKGAPCANCVEQWLKQRLVWVEKADLSELKLRRELIAELLGENTPHAFYEIMSDGTATKLEGIVFPHPDCSCNRGNYVAPDQITKKTNFAFSPIFQLRCARFGTPDGNLWLSAATGDAPLSKERVRTFGVASEREPSRFNAVDEWLKRAAIVDLRARTENGEPLTAECFQSSVARIIPGQETKSLLSADTVGVGATREEAILDGLHQVARAKTLSRYAATMKNPMLVVGANNWLRAKVPFFLLQQYDLHILFYPNSMPSWVVGVAAFSRSNAAEKPIFVFNASSEIGLAMDGALHKALAACRPSDFDEGGESRAILEQSSKLNMWWTHWIYRCPKISLKDVLHLEMYPKDLGLWRDYFRDGQPPVSLVPVNHASLPASLKCLVKVSFPLESSLGGVRNVNGIGTLAAFRDALT